MTCFCIFTGSHNIFLSLKLDIKTESLCMMVHAKCISVTEMKNYSPTDTCVHNRDVGLLVIQTLKA